MLSSTFAFIRPDMPEKLAADLREVADELHRNVTPDQPLVAEDANEGIFKVLQGPNFLEILANLSLGTLQGLGAMHNVHEGTLDTLFPTGAVSRTLQACDGAIIGSTITDAAYPALATVELTAASLEEGKFILSISAGKDPTTSAVDALRTLALTPSFVVGAGALVAHLANPENQHHI